jgi:hypothetical protein
LLKIFLKLNPKTESVENVITDEKRNSKKRKLPGKNDKVVNLNLFKIKKSLTEEGFEVIENDKGEIKLILRLAR